MKRFFAVTIALILVVCSLAACGGDGGSAKSVVLSDLLNDINTQCGISGLKVLESASDLNRYYNIAEADVKQCAAELTTAATDFTEIILVEAVDADALGRIKTQLGNHLDTQLNTAKSYTQDAVAMLEKCSVKSTGNYAYLVIAANASDIDATIESALK